MHDSSLGCLQIFVQIKYVHRKLLRHVNKSLRFSTSLNKYIFLTQFIQKNTIFEVECMAKVQLTVACKVAYTVRQFLWLEGRMHCIFLCQWMVTIMVDEVLSMYFLFEVVCL